MEDILNYRRNYKMVRIAINGFGRIGRLAFRQVYDDSDIEVVAIKWFNRYKDTCTFT